MKLEGDIQVDGVVEGQLHIQETLIISQTGRVIGEVYAERVVVNGILEGICHANIVEVLNQGCLTGTVYSDNLSIERGGKFIGNTNPSPSPQMIELTKSQDCELDHLSREAIQDQSLTGPLSQKSVSQSDKDEL